MQPISTKKAMFKKIPIPLKSKVITLHLEQGRKSRKPNRNNIKVWVNRPMTSLPRQTWRPTVRQGREGVAVARSVITVFHTYYSTKQQFPPPTQNFMKNLQYFLATSV